MTAIDYIISFIKTVPLKAGRRAQVGQSHRTPLKMFTRNNSKKKCTHKTEPLHIKGPLFKALATRRSRWRSAVRASPQTPMQKKNGTSSNKKKRILLKNLISLNNNPNESHFYWRPLPHSLTLFHSPQASHENCTLVRQRANIKEPPTSPSPHSGKSTPLLLSLFLTSSPSPSTF